MMSKKPKRKGRPAKFVIDDNGKEVYGLSYNAASGMFYAAFSNPRIYFGGGKKRYEAQKSLAIQRYKEYQQHQHLSPEQQAEAAFLDKVHNKARELIANDRFMQQELNEKARVLLNLGELSQVVKKKVLQELEQGLQSGELDNYLQTYLESYAGLRLVEKRAAQVLPNLIMDEKVNDALCEQFEKMIKYKPVQAAKALGIKELVYFSNRPFKIKLKWHLVWEIFWEFHKPEHFSFYNGYCVMQKEQFIAVQKKMDVHLHDEDIEKLSMSVFEDALTYHIQTMSTVGALALRTVWEKERFRVIKKREAQEIMTDYLAIPLKDRLIIIDRVFHTVRLEGFPRCEHVRELISNLLRHL